MSKTAVVGIGLVIVGVVCGAVEKTLYGNRLSTNNVLQESFFLPLSIFLTSIGVIVLTYVGARFLWKLRWKIRA
jgi:hypothetical protein